MLHHRATALVLSVALTLVGCSDDPEPKIADPSDGESSSSTEPVSDPPTSTATPEPVRETAEEFIRRYAQAEKALQNTGQPGPYLALTNDCASCEELAETIKSYYAAGGDVQWGGWTIRSVRKYNGSARQYAVDVDSAPTSYKASSTASEMRLEGGRVTYLMTLERRGSTWLVTDISRRAS